MRSGQRLFFGLAIEKCRARNVNSNRTHSRAIQSVAELGEFGGPRAVK